MRTSLLTLCFIIFSLASFAQAQTGTVEYQKNPQIAAVIELPYSPDVVTGALKEHLARKGKSTGSDVKGFITFRNAVSDSANADLYFKVERKSRKDKETSVVSLMLGLPDEGAGSKSARLTMEQAKFYLNNLVPGVEAYNLEILIKEQNSVVQKSESKYKNLVEDGDDLEKKRQAIVKKIAENKADQERQALDIEKQKEKLTVLVGQRK